MIVFSPSGLSASSSPMTVNAAWSATGGKSSCAWQPSERLMIWLPALTASIIAQATWTSVPMPSLSTAL